MFGINHIINHKNYKYELVTNGDKRKEKRDCYYYEFNDNRIIILQGLKHVNLPQRYLFTLMLKYNNNIITRPQKTFIFHHQVWIHICQ